MLMAFGVVMAAGAHGIGRRAITIWMDVEGVLLAGIEALEVGHDFHRGSLLGETHGPLALVARGGMQDRHRLLKLCQAPASRRLGAGRRRTCSERQRG